jgi:hypothetical protein
VTDTELPLLTRRSALLAVAIVLEFFLLLYWQGRPIWCKYGLGLSAGAWMSFIIWFFT